MSELKDAYQNYKPLGARVLIRPIILNPETTSKSVFMADNFQEPEYHAEVVSLGPKVQEVKLQDVIIYPSYGVVLVKIKGEDLFVIEEDNILLITDKKVELVELKPETETENEGN